MTVCLQPLAWIWRPVLPAPWLAVVLLLLTAMLLVQGRSLVRRLGVRRTWPILAARGLAVLLLLAALLDPAQPRALTETVRRRLLVLVDRSASMAVADGGQTTREQRADAWVRALTDRLDDRAELIQWAFTDTVWMDGSPATNTSRGTDLNGALLAAADQAGDAAAIVLLTDGGDDPPDPIRLPRAPLLIGAMGTDAAVWRDTGIDAWQGPETVERGTRFTLTANLRARGHEQAGFREALEKTEATLWHHPPHGEATAIQRQTLDLRTGRAQARFEAQCEVAGVHRFRIELAPPPGDLSPLNNRRSLRVEARGDTLDVLYFSRRLGADLKRLRQALSADPALTFTALYRTGGERYTVQAPEGIDAADLRQGLPTGTNALRRFDCILLGAFPAQLWSAAEMRAVLDYVDAGGGLVWLGGEEAFEGGGYETSALAPLIPWRMTGGTASLVREPASVFIPPDAAADPAVAGLRDLLAEIGSAREAEDLRLAAYHLVHTPAPAARVLLEVARPEGRSPVLIAQPYGNGRVYAFASNTSWQWAGGTAAMATFYRRLWQQVVRAAAGSTEGGRHLQVVWEGNRLRPSGRTSATIQALNQAGRVEFRATLGDPQGNTLTLPLTPGEAPGNWRADLAFRTRGEHLFKLEALQNERVLEIYEKRLDVAPPREEGTLLECQTAWLRQLAAQTGGICHPETEAGALLDAIDATFGKADQTEWVARVSRGPGFALLLLAAFALEWALRRRLNLI